MKQGFSAPDASWFRGESIDYVQRTLLGGKARIYEFLDRDTVHRLVEEHLDGPRKPPAADLVVALSSSRCARAICERESRM